MRTKNKTNYKHTASSTGTTSHTVNTTPALHSNNNTDCWMSGWSPLTQNCWLYLPPWLKLEGRCIPWWFWAGTSADVLSVTLGLWELVAEAASLAGCWQCQFTQFMSDTIRTMNPLTSPMCVYACGQPSSMVPLLTVLIFLILMVMLTWAMSWHKCWWKNGESTS